MEAKAAAPGVPSYNEFEPFCQWQREEDRDVLVIHLPDFKKEHLKVQINNRGILKVSGERSIDAWKKSKFYKEVQVPKNCNTDGIQAKLANGCLYVTMPKRTTAPPPPEQTTTALPLPEQTTKAPPPPEQTKQPPEADGSGVDHKTKSEAVQDRVEKPAAAENKETAGSSKEKMLPSPGVAATDGNKFAKDATKPERSVSRMKTCAKKSLNIAVAMAALVALIAYVFYMYRSTVLED